MKSWYGVDCYPGLELVGCKITRKPCFNFVWDSTSLGTTVASTVLCKLWKSCFVTRSSWSHRFTTCFSVPRNKLCMGSITSILIGSKYGSFIKTEYRQPNSDSFFAGAVFLWHCWISFTFCRCDVTLLGCHVDQSNPEKFIVPTLPGKALRHLKHPNLAVCPRKPHTLWPAGVSRDT